MDRNQINNLVGFVFNFHIQCDVDWEKQDPSYIKEKWGKYIGTDTTSNFIVDEYYHLSRLLRNDKINKWLNIWKVSEKEFLEMKEIVYLLCVLNTKSIILPEGSDKVWDLESLIEEFSKFTDIEKINKDLYNHQHAFVQREIVKWLNKPQNKRYYNLNLLV